MFDNEKDQMIASLKEELDGLSERLANEQQARANSEVRMAAMVKARDPAETDQIALDYATRIENLFANGWDGVNQRRNAVKCVIREVIDIVLLGAKHEDI